MDLIPKTIKNKHILEYVHSYTHTHTHTCRLNSADYETLNPLYKQLQIYSYVLKFNLH